MTGDDVRRLREQLGMSVPHFAQLLGVHIATAYRWETMQRIEIALDPLHASLMSQLQRSASARRRKAEQEAWGRDLVASVLLGGTLAGLALLLTELGDKPVRRRKRRA